MVTGTILQIMIGNFFPKMNGMTSRIEKTMAFPVPVLKETVGIT